MEQIKIPKINPGNIWSGSKTLAVFTNPTELAYKKGNLKHHYPIEFNKKKYADVEEAYHKHKEGSLKLRAELITVLIIIKFRTYPILMDTIKFNGGVDWLKSCSHHSGARSKSFQSWEGDGEKSLFIQCLIDAYDFVTKNPG